jgi:uncharacterized protein YccT (UPF0319 family)
MFVFGTNERTVKTEAKKQLEYWFEKLEVGGTRKFKNFLKEWLKNSVRGLCIT